MAKPGKKRANRAIKIAERLGRARLYALCFFLFSMPIFLLPQNTEYGYAKTIYTLVFVSLLLILWGVEAVLRREVKVELSWLWPILPALIFASFFSLTGGAPACVTVQSATLILYFGFIYLLIVNTAHGERELKLLLSALLVSGVLNALYGLLQYLGVTPGGPGAGLNRVISTMGNREYLAGFLAYLVFPTAILLKLAKRPWARALALVSWGFVLAMTLFVRQTGVRMGLLGGGIFLAFGAGFFSAKAERWKVGAAVAGVTVAAVGVVTGFWGLIGLMAVVAIGAALWVVGRFLRRHRWAWIPTLITVLVALFLLIPPTTPFPAIERIWEENSGRIRAWDWWVGYEMWQDHPLFGIGLGAYKLSFVPYKADFLATPRGADYRFTIPRAAQAHNEYVQVAAELGVVGLVVLLTGIGLIAYFGLRRVAAQDDRGKRLELLLLGAGLITAFIHALVSFPWHLPAPALAFLATLGITFSPPYGRMGGFIAHLSHGQSKAALGVLTALGIAVSVIAVRDVIADHYLWAGQNSLHTKNTALARAQLERAVALDFCPANSLYWLGVAQFQADDYTAAQATFRKCLSRYGGEELYINLTSVDIELGDYAEARSLLEQLLTTRPLRDMELAARYLLAVIDLREGDHQAAERKLQELLAIDSQFERALLLLGDIARASYRYDEAKAHYQRALEIITRKIGRLQAKERLTPEEYSTLLLLSQEREAAERALAQLP